MKDVLLIDFSKNSVMYMRFKLIPETGISGMGTNVQKLVDSETDEELGYVGEVGGKDVIHFTKPIPIRRLVHIANEFAERLEVPIAPRSRVKTVDVLSAPYRN